MADIMDNGSYAVYLYIRRKRSPNIVRRSQEEGACNDLQRYRSGVFSWIESYCARGVGHTGVLTPEQVNWGISELQRRFGEDIQLFTPKNLRSPGMLQDVIDAHKRLLTVLANWAASERVWVETSGAGARRAEGYIFDSQWRKARYEEMHAALMKVTKDFEANHDPDVFWPLPEKPGRRGAISIE